MGRNPGRRHGGGQLTTPRSIILIGLPGAGKSTVAPQVARLLDTTWCDLDQRIVVAEQRSIAELFHDKGEAAFRELERQMMHRAMSERPQVIATGGGWAAESGNLAAVGDRALTIYLSVSAAEGARRLQHTVDRPMLGSTGHEERLRTLLGERERWYRQAAIEIATDALSPEAVATAAANAGRQLAGWGRLDY